MADCFPCNGDYITPENMVKKSIVCSDGNVAFNVVNSETYLYFEGEYDPLNFDGETDKIHFEI